MLYIWKRKRVLGSLFGSQNLKSSTLNAISRWAYLRKTHNQLSGAHSTLKLVKKHNKHEAQQLHEGEKESLVYCGSCTVAAIYSCYGCSTRAAVHKRLFTPSCTVTRVMRHPPPWSTLAPFTKLPQ